MRREKDTEKEICFFIGFKHIYEAKVNFKELCRYIEFSEGDFYFPSVTCLGMSSMRMSVQCVFETLCHVKEFKHKKMNSLSSHIKGSFTILIPRINISIDLNSHCINTHALSTYLALVWLDVYSQSF